MQFSNDLEAFRANEHGVYVGVEEDEYHAHPGLSNSRLNVFRISPRKMRYQMDHPTGSTPAQLIGTAAHAALLERDKFDHEFVTASQCSAFTKQGKQCSKMGSLIENEFWFCGTHASPTAYVPRYMIKPEQRDKVLNMSQWCHTFPGTKGLLVDENDNPRGEREITILWEIEGVLAKCRIDLLCLEGGYALDYKTTENLEKNFGISYMRSRNIAPTEDAITSSTAIYKWGYYRQGAYYSDALAYHGLNVNHFVFLVQEKDPPYEAVALRLHDTALQIGRDEYTLEAKEYAKLVEKDFWPSAAPTKVIEVDLPKWAYGNQDW